MARGASRTLLLGAAMALGAAVVWAAEVPAPQTGNAEILSELKAIRALMEKLVAASESGGRALPASTRALLPVIPSPYADGSPTAPVTIVEFTDLQCPFCRQFRMTTFPELKKQYIDTGKVRFLSFDFPLEAIHPMAIPAAKASRCAVEQGKGLQMREAILTNNENLSADIFVTLAGDLGMDKKSFQACVADPARFGDELKANQAYGKAAGVDGTPNFVVAPTSASKIEGEKIPGALPLDAFRAEIEKLLAAKAR